MGSSDHNLNNHNLTPPDESGHHSLLSGEKKPRVPSSYLLFKWCFVFSSHLRVVCESDDENFLAGSDSAIWSQLWTSRPSAAGWYYLVPMAYFCDVGRGLSRGDGHTCQLSAALLLSLWCVISSPSPIWLHENLFNINADDFPRLSVCLD